MTPQRDFPAHIVRGTVWRNDHRGAAEVRVRLRGPLVDGELALATTDPRGRFELRHALVPDTEYELAVDGAAAQPIRLSVRAGDTGVRVDAALLPPNPEEVRWIDGRGVDARVIAAFTSDGPSAVRAEADAFGPTEHMTTSDRARLLVELLRPDPSDDLRAEGGCEGPLLRFAEAVLAAVSAPWLDDWLGPLVPSAPEFAQEHRCEPFRILYEAGEAGPDPHASRTPITLPGTGAVLAYTDPGGPPNYVQRVCFWLAYARDRFREHGFRDPGPNHVPVVLTTAYSGAYAKNGIIFINPGLGDDDLAWLLAHEYMHLVQEAYEPAGPHGPWYPGREGGSVLAEELVVPAANTHVGHANAESGVLTSPERSLRGGQYSLSLLLHYLAEQHPRGGQWVYRTWLERFAASGYGSGDLAPTLHDLWPASPLSGIRHLGGAWGADETLLGNFWLACVLKDLHATAPDARFGFRCNAETALLTTYTRYDRLRPVHVARDRLARRRTPYLVADRVEGYAVRIFRVDVPSAVDAITVEFSASAGFARPLVQVAVVEPGQRVREIVRSADTSWTERFASEEKGSRIHHLWMLVAAGDAGGAFRLTVASM